MMMMKRSCVYGLMSRGNNVDNNMKQGRVKVIHVVVNLSVHESYVILHYN